jgi:hypothetical protein
VDSLYSETSLKISPLGLKRKTVLNIRYLDPLERLEFEIIQRREEGREQTSLPESFNRLKTKTDSTAQTAAYALLADLMAREQSTVAGLANEPNELDKIRQAASHQTASPQPPCELNESDIYDRLLGGWLGRAAGCLPGKPVERYPRPVLRQMLESNNNWPLDNYW